MHLQVKNKPIQNQLSYDLISVTESLNAASASPGLLLWTVKSFSNTLKKANPPNRVSPLRILADLLLFEKAHLNRKIPSTWDQLVGNLQRRQNTSSIHTANADDQTEQPSWNFNIYHLPVLKTKYFWGDKNLDLRIINC